MLTLLNIIYLRLGLIVVFIEGLLRPLLSIIKAYYKLLIIIIITIIANLTTLASLLF